MSAAAALPVDRLHRRVELDGLRGVAILAVLFFHARWPAFQGGFIGVEAFFVLSGFLITSLLLAEFQADGRIRLGHFFIRRALRLMPALALMLAVFVAAGWLFAPRWLAVSNSVDALIAFFNLSNWARAFGWRPHNMIGHTWSLGIEQQFYLVWAPLAALALRLRGARLLLLLAVIIGLGSWGWRVVGMLRGESFDRLYNGLDTRADGLMLGAAGAALASLGFWESGPGAGFLRAAHCVAPFALAGLLAAAMLADWQSPGMYFYGFVTVEILTLLVILDALYFRDGWVAWCLRARWLVWVGAISYGLYIWHYPLFQLLLFGFHWPPALVGTAGSALAISIAAASYYLVEKPALALKKRFG